MKIFKEDQPDILTVSKRIRLIKFREIIPEAFAWYQDRETLRLVDGPDRRPYDRETLSRMYRVLGKMGELYYIEYQAADHFYPIGDVTLALHDLPIVIGDPACRGKGIGSQVINALVERATRQGLKHLYVREIYDYNIASQKLFLKYGFRREGKTKLGHAYHLVISS
ncbi:GNAT family protein [Sporolactobacillus sp. Y61]|uniref:GNAT family protein n=1 Tax=Sporolactobacillus sp. Y61 TaxID=3160863 RepID=A0AAU8IDM7_9BACL